jgi:hypothetical protein
VYVWLLAGGMLSFFDWLVTRLFVTEKKAAILWDTVVQKLIDSHTSCLPPGTIPLTIIVDVRGNI